MKKSTKEIEGTKILNDKFSMCTGTEHYYKHWTNRGVYTDGVKAMAEEFKAYWLIDVVLSYQDGKIRKVPFQIWEIVSENSKAVVEMKEDTDEPILVQQKIPYTDFPEGTFKMYYINDVLLLPSEY